MGEENERPGMAAPADESKSLKTTRDQRQQTAVAKASRGAVVVQDSRVRRLQPLTAAAGPIGQLGLDAGLTIGRRGCRRHTFCLRLRPLSHSSPRRTVCVCVSACLCACVRLSLGYTSSNKWLGARGRADPRCRLLQQHHHHHADSVCHIRPPASSRPSTAPTAEHGGPWAAAGMGKGSVLCSNVARLLTHWVGLSGSNPRPPEGPSREMVEPPPRGPSPSLVWIFLAALCLLSLSMACHCLVCLVCLISLVIAEEGTWGSEGRVTRSSLLRPDRLKPLRAGRSTATRHNARESGGRETRFWMEDLDSDGQLFAIGPRLPVARRDNEKAEPLRPMRAYRSAPPAAASAGPGNEVISAVWFVQARGRERECAVTMGGAVVVSTSRLAGAKEQRLTGRASGKTQNFIRKGSINPAFVDMAHPGFSPFSLHSESSDRDHGAGPSTGPLAPPPPPDNRLHVAARRPPQPGHTPPPSHPPRRILRSSRDTPGRARARTRCLSVWRPHDGRHAATGGGLVVWLSVGATASSPLAIPEFMLLTQKNEPLSPCWSIPP